MFTSVPELFILAMIYVDKLDVNWQLKPTELPPTYLWLRQNVGAGIRVIRAEPPIQAKTSGLELES